MRAGASLFPSSAVHEVKTQSNCQTVGGSATALLRPSSTCSTLHLNNHTSPRSPPALAVHSSQNSTTNTDLLVDHMEEVYDVCVVGGGLGGLALAIGLEQLGLDWQLCESAEELRWVSHCPRAHQPIPTTQRSQCALPACLPAGLQLARSLDWEAMGCTLWRQFPPSSSHESSE